MDRRPVNSLRPLLATMPFSEPVLNRLKAYWTALGVTDPKLALALSEQSLRRLPELHDEAEVSVRSIIAAGELLDDWLATALDLRRPSTALSAARAALLSGAVPEWPTVLFAPPDTAGAALERLRVAVAEPTPAPSLGLMPAQRIEPLWKLP